MTPLPVALALVVALPGLAVASALGWAIDRALGWRATLELGWLGWPVRTLAGLAALVALALHPVALLALAAALFAISRSLARERAGAAAEPDAAPEADARKRADVARVAALLLAAVTLVATLRPAVPLYWDEHVWLAKSRLALSLRDAALDPSAGVIPVGYPILASLAESLFALARADVPSLVAGATALVLLCLATALAALPPPRRLPWALALAAAPLVWIHLRSAHLDLAVGLLALSVAASLARAADDPASRSALPLAAISAFLVAGTKDEGLAHVVAIAAAHLLASADRRLALRRATSGLAPALIAALGWRVLLALHRVAPRDHALDGAGLDHAGAIASELVRAACDLTSWGLAWPIALGAALAALTTRGPDAARPRFAALTLLVVLAALLAGLLLGSERLQIFTLTGTLANRLLVQLAPLAAWSFAETYASLAPASSPWRRRAT